MGNQMSTDTLCSQDANGHSYWVGVDWKSFAKGDNKKCYQGCLNGWGPRSGEKVAVKAFKEKTDSRSRWRLEKLKSKTAQCFLDIFREEELPSGSITINIPFIALMDTVSKMNELFGSRSRSRSLNNNEWVGIEEFIPGKFSHFCPSCPRAANQRSALLEAFSHFTYQTSRGAFVICDFQGVEKDGRYHLTNPVIHSQNGEFGAKDLGVHGINEFFKMHRCNDTCRDWSMMGPLSPPPSFEDIYGDLPFYHPCASAPPLENDG